MEPGRQRLSQRRKAAALVVGPPVDRPRAAHPAGDLFRPQAAGPVEAAPVEVAPVEAVPSVPSSPQLIPSGSVPAKGVPAWSRRVTRVGVTGTLAVVIAGGAVSVPLLRSHHAVAPRLSAEAAAPVAVIPAADLASSASLPAEDHPAPAVTPVKDVEHAVPPAVAAAPQTRPAWHDNRITIRPKRAAVMVTPPQDSRDARARAAADYVRSRAEALQEGDYRWVHVPSHR